MEYVQNNPGKRCIDIVNYFEDNFGYKNFNGFFSRAVQRGYINELLDGTYVVGKIPKRIVHGLAKSFLIDYAKTVQWFSRKECLACILNNNNKGITLPSITRYLVKSCLFDLDKSRKFNLYRLKDEYR